MRSKLIILGIVILLLMQVVSATTLTEFNDSSSSGNMTFNGTNNFTYYLNPPLYSMIFSANLTLKGWGYPTPENYTLGELSQGDTAYGDYRGLWTTLSGTDISDTSFVHNPEYSNDGNQSTKTVVEPSHTFYYYLNFSNDNLTKQFFMKYTQGASGGYPSSLDVYCKNQSSNSWHGFLLNDSIPYAPVVDTINVSLPSWCTNQTNTVTDSPFIELRLFWTIETWGTGLWDVWLTRNITKPENVTILLNGTQIYNYDSIFNFTKQVSLTDTGTFQNYINTQTPIPLTFLSNNSGILEYYGIEVYYSTNQTIRVYDELTNTLFTTSNITVNRLLNSTDWDSYWTTTGHIYTDNSNVSGIMDLEYYDRNNLYSTRHYYYINNENTTTNQTLYIMPRANSSDVLFTLYRENGEVLPNYYVEVYKRWKDTNEYMLVEMHETDFNGQAIMNLELVDASYQFKVRNTNFEIVYESSGDTNILSTSLSLTIQTIEDIWASLENIDDILVDLSFDNITSQFIYTYDDTNEIGEYFDFITIRRTMYADHTICNNRSYESSDVLYCTINTNLSGVFVSHVYVESRSNHSYYPLIRADYTRPLAESQTQFGVFAAMILTLGIALLGLFSPVIAIVLSIIGLITAVLLKLIYIQYGMLITIIIIGGVIAYKIRT